MLKKSFNTQCECFWTWCSATEEIEQSWKWEEGRMSGSGLSHRYPSRLFSWLTGWRRLQHTFAYFLEVSAGVALKLLRGPSSHSKSWKQWKHALTPHRRLHHAPKSWNIWTVFSNKVYLEIVVGYFGTMTFYKYLTVMSVQNKMF